MDSDFNHLFHLWIVSRLSSAGTITFLRTLFESSFLLVKYFTSIIENSTRFKMKPVVIARIFHELPAATVYLAVLPGVLGCYFDRLRTSSPCDVLRKYASDPTPCGCPLSQPSPRSRDSNL
jgi:hypothetical protein